MISMLGFPQESLLLRRENSALFSWRKPSPQSATSIAVHVLSSIWRAGGCICLLRGQCLDVVFSLIPTLKAFFQPIPCFITQPERNPDDEKIFPLEASERLFVAIEEDDVVDAQSVCRRLSH